MTQTCALCVTVIAILCVNPTVDARKTGCLKDVRGELLAVNAAAPAALQPNLPSSSFPRIMILALVAHMKLPVMPSLPEL